MRTFTKTTGLLFLAAASVYSSQAIAAAVGISAPSRGARVYAAPEALPTTTQATVGEAPAGEIADPFAETAEAAPVSEGKSVSETDVSMSDLGTVEIHVNDANLVEVLRMLSLQSQRNIIASKEVRGTITANLYDVTVAEALDAILHANGYAYREKGNFIYVYTIQEIEELEKAERRVETRVFRVSYTPAANAETMIKPVLSESGEVAVSTPALSGIETGTTGTGGNDHATEDLLVVTDYPEVLDRVARILEEIDRRPQQILLEATILRATLNEDNSLGVDFNLLAGVNFDTFTSSNGQLNGAGIDSGASKAGEAVSGGTGNAFTNNITGGLKVGFISDNVSVFLSALEAVTDTTILANPKILALNKQKGEVFVGNEDGYKTTVTTETTVSETVETLKTGTRLIFRPYIADDGYIRMEVHPEDSAGEVNLTTQLPKKSTTEVTSNIMVKDGRTIVIGGLFRESTVVGRNQIPILGNLPYAGALFRQQRDRTVREEVIILLTPHIIKDDSAYADLSERELRMADQLRVGARHGLMPYGRERLAESAYEKARAELNKPNPNRRKVLWHLNCATNLNPRMVEAIDLKEQVSGKVVSATDSSSIRSFVRRAAIEDYQIAVPPATQPVTTGSSFTTFAPSTQPATVAAAPATQPVAEASHPTTMPITSFEPTAVVVEEMPLEEEAFALEPVELEPVAEAAPSTQPIESSITELPFDEIEGASWDVDGIPAEVGTK